MDLHWGWDGDEVRHWTLCALGGRNLAVVVKLCSEEPQVVTEKPQGLWAPKLNTTAFTSVTVASHFSVPDTWQTFIKDFL